MEKPSEALLPGIFWQDSGVSRTRVSRGISSELGEEGALVTRAPTGLVGLSGTQCSPHLPVTGISGGVGQHASSWQRNNGAVATKAGQALIDIVENMGVAVYAFSKDGRLCYCFWHPGLLFRSKAAQPLFGHTEDEVLGRNCVSLIPAPHFQEAARRILRQVLSLGHAFQGRVSVQVRSGAVMEVLLRDEPIRDSRGSVVGGVGVAQPLDTVNTALVKQGLFMETRLVPAPGSRMHRRGSPAQGSFQEGGGARKRSRSEEGSQVMVKAGSWGPGPSYVEGEGGLDYGREHQRGWMWPGIPDPGRGEGAHRQGEAGAFSLPGFEDRSSTGEGLKSGQGAGLSRETVAAGKAQEGHGLCHTGHAPHRLCGAGGMGTTEFQMPPFSDSDTGGWGGQTEPACCWRHVGPEECSTSREKGCSPPCTWLGPAPHLRTGRAMGLAAAPQSPAEMEQHKSRATESHPWGVQQRLWGSGRGGSHLSELQRELGGGGPDGTNTNSDKDRTGLALAQAGPFPEQGRLGHERNWGNTQIAQLGGGGWQEAKRHCSQCPGWGGPPHDPSASCKQRGFLQETGGADVGDSGATIGGHKLGVCPAIPAPADPDGAEAASLDTGTCYREQSAGDDRSSYEDGLLGGLTSSVQWNIRADDLNIGAMIGRGASGSVHKGVWNATEVAVKLFHELCLAPGAQQEFQPEASLLASLRHPNIVLFLGVTQTPSHLGVVTEYMPRGSLFEVLRRPREKNLSLSRRLSMALDVARGLQYLHSCSPPIVHHDLKSANLLVDRDWTVKVTDFGLSKLCYSSLLSVKSGRGTPQWMAPEVLGSEGSGKKADVYSFGVILWEVFTGKVPWEGMNAMQVFGAVGFMNQSLQINDIGYVKIRQLTEACLERFPERRPFMTKIIEILSSLAKEATVEMCGL